jgi:hypothetical protein
MEWMVELQIRCKEAIAPTGTFAEAMDLTRQFQHGAMRSRKQNAVWQH